MTSSEGIEVKVRSAWVEIEFDNRLLAEKLGSLSSRNNLSGKMKQPFRQQPTFCPGESNGFATLHIRGDFPPLQWFDKLLIHVTHREDGIFAGNNIFNTAAIGKSFLSSHKMLYIYILEKINDSLARARLYCELNWALQHLNIVWQQTRYVTV